MEPDVLIVPVLTVPALHGLKLKVFAVSTGFLFCMSCRKTAENHCAKNKKKHAYCPRENHAKVSHKAIENQIFLNLRCRSSFRCFPFP
jgi:hypothetical protein